MYWLDTNIGISWLVIASDLGVLQSQISWASGEDFPRNRAKALRLDFLFTFHHCDDEALEIVPKHMAMHYNEF